MYCKKCGKKNDNNSIYCNYCGVQIIDNSDEIIVEKVDNTKTNGLALAGFIVSIVSLFFSFWGMTPLVGLILSIVGYSNIKKTNENGKGFAIAGIIIASISLLISFIALFFVFLFAFL